MDPARRYPGIADLARAAERRLPRFAWEFLAGGIGEGACLARNRAALDRIELRPRYLCDADTPDLGAELLGRRHALPFGASPVGLDGLAFPRAAELIAAAARRADIPAAVSSYMTTTLERIAAIAPEHAWYQHYMTNRPEVEADLIRRAREAGYRVLVVTVDVPTRTKRDHDVRNGLTVPPRFDLGTAAQILARPRWALAMLGGGIPRFENLAPYVRPGAGSAEIAEVVTDLIEGHVSVERLAALRGQWPHKLLVKGVLGAADVEECRRIGVDGVVVSNHGGRQLDAAPAVPDVLPEIVRAAGGELAVVADSGVRSGLDVARMLACGADFVLLGRAFLFGVAVLGARGADHVIAILAEELRATLAQLGCPAPGALPQFRVAPGGAAR